MEVWDTVLGLSIWWPFSVINFCWILLGHIVFYMWPDLPKGVLYTHSSGLTFHGHSTDTAIGQQFMLVPLPKLQWSAFTEASFMGLCGIYGCSDVLWMAPTCPARQTDGKESLQDWLVTLGIDVATFWDVWSWKQPDLKPFGHKKVLYRKSPPLHGYPPPPTLHPYRNACGIGYLVK